MTDEPATLECPQCGNAAKRSQTRYGVRDSCYDCNLWSWGGKPLVSGEVHGARKHCHNVVDALWKRADAIYDVSEPPGTEAHEKAVKRIRRAARGRTYRYIAEQLEIPEPAAHMSNQTDIEILRDIYRVARAATPTLIRAWSKANQAHNPEEEKTHA